MSKIDSHCFFSFKREKSSAFENIYNQYKRQLYVLCYKYLHNEFEAEDVVLQTFMELYESKDKILDLKHLNNWLFLTAKRCSIDLARTKFSKKEILYKAELAKIEDVNIDYNEEVFLEIIDQVYSEINLLPRQQKDVFILRYIKNYSAKEVADHMKISLNTVYAHSKVAMKNIKLKFLTTPKFSI